MRKEGEVKSLFYKVVENGQVSSYELLYKTLAIQLIRFSASITGSFHLAEEIVSDVFIMVWQKRTQLRDVKEPVLFLYTCTRNLSLNKIGSRKEILDFDALDPDILSVVPDVEDRLVSSEVVQLIEKAIRGLPARCQLIFRLVRMDGLSYKEVAELLDISVKTVDTQLAIAIKKLSIVIRLDIHKDLIHSFLSSE